MKQVEVEVNGFALRWEEWDEALSVSQVGRKLRLGETSGVHVFVKSGLPLEDSASVFLGVENADRLVEFPHDNPVGFQQVGIATDHHSAIEEVQMRVVEQVGGKVHIGAFFLGLDDIDGSGAAGNGIGERHLDGFREKMPAVDLAIWARAQSAEVERLAERLVWIILFFLLQVFPSEFCSFCWDKET